MKYEIEHAVECPVPRDFAWRFWTRVENWAAVDPSVEAVTLDGPFAAGTRGATKPRGLPPTEWRLAEVEEGRRAVIEVALPGAAFSFEWSFEGAAGGATRMTQRVTLEGERAADYAGAMPEFEAGMPAGMRSLAAAMERREKLDA
jgi:hypothetical protein